jgi:hypothetical protein
MTPLVDNDFITGLLLPNICTHLSVDLHRLGKPEAIPLDCADGASECTKQSACTHTYAMLE